MLENKIYNVDVNLSKYIRSIEHTIGAIEIIRSIFKYAKNEYFTIEGSKFFSKFGGFSPRPTLLIIAKKKHYCEIFYLYAYKK